MVIFRLISPRKLDFRIPSTGSSLLRLYNSSVNDSLSPSKSARKKRLDVAIVGAPNAGKSQLLNVLVQSPVAAVSRKRHTTRSGILGARTIDDTQLLFIDTPGFLKLETAKQEGLFKDLVKVASRELDRADYTLIVVDAARRLDESMKQALVYLMLRAHHSLGRQDDFLDDDDDDTEILRDKFAIVLNKVDLIHPKDKLLELATELAELGEACVRYRWQRETQDQDDSSVTKKISYTDVPKLLSDLKPDSTEIDSALSISDASDDELLELAAQYPPIFYISALEEDGIHDIVKHLQRLATPCESWVLPSMDESDEEGVMVSGHTHGTPVTNMSYTERVQEIIREKLFRCLHQEVPFAISQENRVFRFIRLEQASDETVARIDQDLIVRTKSHYNLVMGRSGMTLKRIQETARRDLIGIMPKGCKDVILNLHVKLSRSRNSLNADRALESDRHGITSSSLR